MRIGGFESSQHNSKPLAKTWLAFLCFIYKKVTVDSYFTDIYSFFSQDTEIDSDFLFSIIFITWKHKNGKGSLVWISASRIYTEFLLILDLKKSAVVKDTEIWRQREGSLRLARTARCHRLYFLLRFIFVRLWQEPRSTDIICDLWAEIKRKRWSYWFMFIMVSLSQ